MRGLRGFTKLSGLLASTQPVTRTWKLIGTDGNPYDSDRPGTLGGHRRSHIYGRLDCPPALPPIARGGYTSDRLFFLNEEYARAAGYRPCAVCLPAAYAAWQARRLPVPLRAPSEK